nr:DsbA family oxidoreductase [Kineosporia sp. A_224]
MNPQPSAQAPMRVEIWSDVVCPWCYIGKRRFESALAAFPEADRVEVVWRSFQLDPTAPAHDPGRPAPRVAEYLGAKYGGGTAQAEQMMAQVDAVAAGEGLHYDQSESRFTNTLDAHRLIHAALEHGGPALQGAVKERLLAAYFTQKEDVGDPATLVRLAAEAGLPEDLAREVLASDAHRDAVRADQAQAQAFGANGVPFFVLDRKYGVSGAQPAEVFADVLAKAWADHAPVTILAGAVGTAGAQGEVCGPDGC